ncbi:MAG: hypothetical protein U0X73_09970 [Thermoanaerobaculia bacterium]
MMTARWTAIAVCLALLAGCERIQDWVGESDQKKAEKRVKFIFDAVTEKGERDSKVFQTAICRWMNDTLVPIDSGTFEWAYDQFRQFNAEGGLTIGSTYEIEGSRANEDSAGLEWVVFGTANSRPFEVIVPDRAALRWKTAPKSDY